MNWIHLHLALNHVPVMGSLFVGLLMVIAVVRRSEEMKRVALGWLVGLMLVSVPIKFTGDYAAPKAQGLPGVEPGLVERHETAADQATTAIFLAGIVAGIALFMGRKGRPVPSWAFVTALILTLVTFGMMARTANSGGELRHPEIRSLPDPGR
ncbi:MAG: hypothetical protein ISQ14_07295 [Verrucomicrobiae bacterium]|nr:hypothetical protein [Verrucomicrobiae bacterium]